MHCKLKIRIQKKSYYLVYSMNIADNILKPYVHATNATAAPLPDNIAGWKAAEWGKYHV